MKKIIRRGRARGAKAQLPTNEPKLSFSRPARSKKLSFEAFRSFASGLKFTALGIIVFVGFVVFLDFSNVRAGASDNVFGYAFAKDFGYLSMNCNNTPNLDGSGARADDCSVPYGTTIATNNKFSGLSWGPNIGWVCWGAACNGMQLPGGVTLPSDFAAQVSVGAATKGNLDGHATSGKGGYAMTFPSGGEVALSGTATDGSPFGVFVNTTGATTSNTNGRCKNDDGTDMTVGAGEFCGLGYNATLGFINFRGLITIPRDIGQDPPTVTPLSPNTTTKNPTTTPTFRWATIDPEGDPQTQAELAVCMNTGQECQELNIVKLSTPTILSSYLLMSGGGTKTETIDITPYVASGDTPDYAMVQFYANHTAGSGIMKVNLPDGTASRTVLDGTGYGADTDEVFVPISNGKFVLTSTINAASDMRLYATLVGYVQHSSSFRSLSSPPLLSSYLLMSGGGTKTETIDITPYVASGDTPDYAMVQFYANHTAGSGTMKVNLPDGTASRTVLDGTGYGADTNEVFVPLSNGKFVLTSTINKDASDMRLYATLVGYHRSPVLQTLLNSAAQSCTYPCGIAGAPTLLGDTAYTWKVRATDAAHALTSQLFSTAVSFNTAAQSGSNSAPSITQLTPNSTTKNVTVTPTFSWATVDPDGDAQAAAELVVCKTGVNADCENDTTSGARIARAIIDGSAQSCTYPCGSAGSPATLDLSTQFNWKIRATDGSHALTSQPFVSSTNSRFITPSNNVINFGVRTTASFGSNLPPSPTPSSPTGGITNVDVAGLGFGWNYTDPEGDQQAEREIVLCRTDLDPNCELPGAAAGSLVFRGRSSVGAFQCIYPCNSSSAPSRLDFNTKFNWKVRVTDSRHSLDEQPFVGGTGGAGVVPLPNSTFTTIPHRAPTASFSTLSRISGILPGVALKFSSTSQCFKFKDASTDESTACQELTWSFCELPNTAVDSCSAEKTKTVSGSELSTAAPSCGVGVSRCSFRFRLNAKDADGFTQATEGSVDVGKRVIPKIRRITPF